MIYTIRSFKPPSYFDEIRLDRKHFDQRWCQWQPAACPSCLPCYDSIHSPLLFPECSEQLQVGWGMVFIPQNVVEYVFVTRAPGIAVKLWFCFWWGTVTGASTRVAFTALICEHNNANISVGGLFQLSCVMISDIDFDWLFFFNTAVSGPCLVLVIYIVFRSCTFISSLGLCGVYFSRKKCL